MRTAYLGYVQSFSGESGTILSGPTDWDQARPVSRFVEKIVVSRTPTILLLDYVLLPNAADPRKLNSYPGFRVVGRDCAERSGRVKENSLRTPEVFGRSLVAVEQIIIIGLSIIDCRQSSFSNFGDVAPEREEHVGQVS